MVVPSSTSLSSSNLVRSRLANGVHWLVVLDLEYPVPRCEESDPMGREAEAEGPCDVPKMQGIVRDRRTRMAGRLVTVIETPSSRPDQIKGPL